MKLNKLFEMQKVLDTRILQQHPELVGERNTPWKTLALQVELAECANEWRGFKKWSTRQIPVKPSEKTNWVDGRCYTIVKHPLLEEYVDCLHFILSIGLELANKDITNYCYQVHGYIKSAWNTETTTEQFQTIFVGIANFSFTYDDEIAYKELVSEFLGLGEMLGFSWEEIENAYISKNEVNHTRQSNGY